MSSLGGGGRRFATTIRYEPIVYRVHAWSADGSGPKVIKRAGSEDPHGILDIGESQHGRGRLGRFAQVALGDKLVSHRAGIDYSTGWGYDFATAFPPAQLRIDVLRVASKELADAVGPARVAVGFFLLERFRRGPTELPARTRT
jgi:hypothetical protein